MVTSGAQLWQETVIFCYVRLPLTNNNKVLWPRDTRSGIWWTRKK